jgi:heme A synthase
VQSLTLAFIFVAILAGLTALARRASPPGRRKDTLSVLLVVLALLAAFLLCFAAGSLVRGERAGTVSQAGIPPSIDASDHGEG